MRRICAVAVVLPFIAGCFPMRIVKTPGATGRVIDSATLAPIDNAKVTVFAGGIGSERPVAVTITNLAGYFSLPPVHGWILYIVPMDLMANGGNLHVEALGYAAASRSIRSYPQGPPSVDCGELKLERVP